MSYEHQLVVATTGAFTLTSVTMEQLRIVVCSSFYMLPGRAHALSNDVNILIMRNPPVITVYFNTTVEQTIKSDGAAWPE